MQRFDLWHSSHFHSPLFQYCTIMWIFIFNKYLLASINTYAALCCNLCESCLLFSPSFQYIRTKPINTYFVVLKYVHIICVFERMKKMENQRKKQIILLVGAVYSFPAIASYKLYWMQQHRYAVEQHTTSPLHWQIHNMHTASWNLTLNSVFRRNIRRHLIPQCRAISGSRIFINFN